MIIFHQFVRLFLACESSKIEPIKLNIKKMGNFSSSHKPKNPIDEGQGNAISQQRQYSLKKFQSKLVPNDLLQHKVLATNFSYFETTPMGAYAKRLTLCEIIEQTDYFTPTQNVLQKYTQIVNPQEESKLLIDKSLAQKLNSCADK